MTKNNKIIAGKSKISRTGDLQESWKLFKFYENLLLFHSRKKIKFLQKGVIN